MTEQRPRTRIALCGRLRLEVDGRDLAAALPEGQPIVLLAFLLVHRERGVERDELVEVLWSHRPPRDPGRALRPVLSRLRRAIDPVAIEGRERVRVVPPAPVWLDLDAATAAVADARAALSAGDPAATGDHAAAAIRLLGDGLLPGLDGAWLAAPRAEQEDLLLEALDLRARAALALGEPEAAAAERAAREIVARSPYRESGHRALMEALALGDNVAEALRVYDDLRVRLREELGTAPAPALQALHGRLLAGEAAPAPPPQPRRPLPAARAAAGGQRDGRSRAELERLRAAWRGAVAGERRLVFVAGEPGIGKTRLVTELAREAHDAGLVLRAASHPDALVPYQPWVEALVCSSPRSASRSRSPGPGGHELARLVPELGEHAPPAAAGDPETRRYVLFEAVADLLDEAVGARARAARPRRPALGRPRHAAPAQPCRPLGPRAGPARRRHLPVDRGAPPGTRWPSCSPTCAASGCSSASCSTASTRRRWRS